MNIHVLFGQRKEAYEGEYAPEALLVWDEYAIDDNPEGWNEAVEAQRKLLGDQMQGMRVMVFQVDQDVVRRKLIGTPVVKATMIDDETLPMPPPVLARVKTSFTEGWRAVLEIRGDKHMLDDGMWYDVQDLELA